MDFDTIKHYNKIVRNYKKYFFKLPKLHNLEKQQLIKYIKKLHYFINLQNKINKKCRLKIKSLKNNIEISESKISNANTSEKENIYKNSVPSSNNDTTNFIESIKEVAETIQNQNGFVYEPTSGLYYDSLTGYYYNAEFGLYYDGQTGSYYKYNQEENSFEFHSQVVTENQIQVHEIYNYRQKRNQDEKSVRESSPESEAKYNSDTSSYWSRYYRRRSKSRRTKSRKKKKKSKSRSRSRNKDNREDGEITSDSDNSVIFVSRSRRSKSGYDDIAKRYPPSLRIIVQETNLTNLKLGELFLVTYKGGTLGREGDHDVIIPDINISKFHLKFVYNERKRVYQCRDLGSRNSTFLNGTRMSNAKQESTLMDLEHGSVLQLSQTKLLCHIHAGHTTCELCEPGLIKSESPPPPKVPTESLTRKQELKRIQKKYALENENYTEVKTNKNYSDRADERRKIVGSSTNAEKTYTASLDASISSDNRGFKMLSKLGWSEGQSLGKNDSGLLEPIPLYSNEGKKGLDVSMPKNQMPIMQKVSNKKTIAWKKAQERYQNITKTNIFNDNDDEIGDS